ncbi:MAG TPA: DUF885 domain-containing protein [Candidatus Limnocylindrales bacterium]|nr:DUF885 domain-containing protein [Candidatus Limnocylindrales bacterium]
MSDFSSLAEAFLRREWELSPVRASGLGLTEYDERLDDLSAETFEQRDIEVTEWRGRFEALPEADLTHDERIDRELLLANLRGREIAADWRAWRRDPLVYSGPALDGIYRLFLHRLRPEPELIDAAVARMEQIPRALEQGRANLEPALAHALIVGRGAAAARGGVRYLRELLPAEVSEGEGRERLQRAGESAAAALEAWVAHLDTLAERASGSWQFGEERYSRLLQEREMLADDARSLRERGRTEYERLDAEMRALARDISGSEDWVQLLEEADQDHPPTEEAMRQAYEDWTARARAFLEQTGLASLPPGERCLVEPSPVFQRPVIGVASYIAPPMYSAGMTGHFFVPFAPDGTPEEEVQQRLAANSHGGIPTTAVHEAYPGHHWHLVSMKANPSRVRRAYGTSYFSEGWALYAERVMRERGFFEEPLHELYHLNATIFRAARIVVDTSLHLGEMSYDEAVRFMVEKTALPEPTARAEVGRYCWWPTQASSYLTGCLEILRIRDRFLAARGAGDTPATQVDAAVLRDFHDRLAGSGALPLGLAERALMEPLAAAV